MCVCVRLSMQNSRQAEAFAKSRLRVAELQALVEKLESQPNTSPPPPPHDIATAALEGELEQRDVEIARLSAEVASMFIMLIKTNAFKPD